MKLHIQLEPFTGKKFDFIEVDITDVNEILSIYEKLNSIRPTNMNTEPTQKGWETENKPFSQGYEIPSEAQLKLLSSLKVPQTQLDQIKTKAQASKAIKFYIEKNKGSK